MTTISDTSAALPAIQNTHSQNHSSATSKASPDTNQQPTTNAATSTQNPTEKTTIYAQDKLTLEQIQQIEKLKQRDQEVRRHEAAHLAAAGQHANGGPTFKYQRGPDGKNYSVGGEVSIDTGKVAGDAQATIQKARQIRSAALAPADPSAQDRQVAAAATQMEAEARIELQQTQTEDTKQTLTDEVVKDDDKSVEKQKQTSAYEAIENFNPEQTISIFDFVA